MKITLMCIITSGSHLARAFARKFFAEEEKSVHAAFFRSSGAGATWISGAIVQAGTHFEQRRVGFDRNLRGTSVYV